MLMAFLSCELTVVTQSPPGFPFCLWSPYWDFHTMCNYLPPAPSLAVSWGPSDVLSPIHGRGKKNDSAALLCGDPSHTLAKMSGASGKHSFWGITPKTGISLASIIFNANHLLTEGKKTESMTSICCKTDDSLV